MALRWSDFCFDDFTVKVQRGIVHGRVDDVKTEYSNDDLPLDREYAALMLRWKRTCPPTREEWVFPNPNTQLPYWQESIAKRNLRPAGGSEGFLNEAEQTPEFLACQNTGLFSPFAHILDFH